jgi:putative transcriptional regulator
MKKQTTTIRFRLAEILQEREISQREAARITGISKNGISVLCGEPVQIRLETLSKLCSTLNVTISDLLVFDNGGAKKA